MNCYQYSSIESSLRPCGIRCSDFKSFLLATSGSEERHILQAIFDNLYFGENAFHRQKKCTVWVDNNIFTDHSIQLFVHLQGDDNLEIQQLLLQSRHFVEDYGYVYSIFGRMQIFLLPYNKCFCDYCLGNNLILMNLKIRVIVFDTFFIPLHREPLSLMELAIKSILPPLECCQVNLLREHVLWLGDGIDPISSACRLSNPRHTIQNFTTFDGITSRAQRSPSIGGRLTRSMKQGTISLTWNELKSGTPYLLIAIYKQQLFLYTLGSFIIRARDYPKKIEQYFTSFNDLVFISRNNHRLCMRNFDRDYQVEKDPIWE